MRTKNRGFKRIWLNILLAFAPSHAMENYFEISKPKQSAAIIEQWGNSIITSFIYIKKICNANSIIPEIVNYIKQCSIALKNKDFSSSSDICLLKWDDFRIPADHHWFLTSHQINLMQNLFTSSPYSGTYDHIRQIHYILQSKKDYQLFITLPIEIRKCLTLMPKSEIEIQQQILPHERNLITKINVNQTIEVKHKSKKPITIRQTQFVGSKPKPILPEEYKKKNQKK